MCDCMSFLIAPLRTLWQRICASWCGVTYLIVPAEHVKLLNAVTARSPRSESYQDLIQIRRFLSSPSNESGTISMDTVLCSTREEVETRNLVGDLWQTKTEASMFWCRTPRGGLSNGSSSIVSLFTKRGQKGVNQDAMLFIEDFASRAGTVFCGVFDGHGPHGHLIAQHVGDVLPRKVAACWHSRYEAAKRSPPSLEEDIDKIGNELLSDRDMIGAWKASLVEAYKLMDRELTLNEGVDCVSSGTTAVTLVKQGCDLILGNVGDSRAILASIAEDGSLVATQLTVDLKPDIPREAERIRRFKGRVFALLNEPSVKRVWLPHLNLPGLAMTRALGDYCLKNHGVISEPEITHWRLTHKDKFIVLATDGVWDVLSNDQVVKMVASTPVKTSAGKVVVDAAVHEWKYKYSSSKVDDCAVVCLFFDNIPSPF